MLLFTWAGLMHHLQDCFYWSFRMMDGPNRNINILFIVIGFIGAIYWLIRQFKYNQKAEEQGTIK
jgi:hypothetical protein